MAVSPLRQPGAKDLRRLDAREETDPRGHHFVDVRVQKASGGYIQQSWSLRWQVVDLGKAIFRAHGLHFNENRPDGDRMLVIQGWSEGH